MKTVLDDITVCDNFLSDDEFKHIENIIMNQYFPWYHSSYVAADIDYDMRHWYNLHTFYNENVPISKYYNDVYEIFMPKIDQTYRNLNEKVHRQRSGGQTRRI